MLIAVCGTSHNKIAFKAIDNTSVRSLVMILNPTSLETLSLSVK